MTNAEGEQWVKFTIRCMYVSGEIDGGVLDVKTERGCEDGGESSVSGCAVTEFM